MLSIFGRAMSQYLDKRSVIIILFLLLETSLAYYIFTHTSQIRHPSMVIQSEDNVTCFDVSNWGESIAIGTENGTISYYKKENPFPKWVFRGNKTTF